MIDLTSEERRLIETRRTAHALFASELDRPLPHQAGAQISEDEWNLIQQRRFAMQSRVAKSGIATSTPDPFREQCAVAIFVLKELRQLASDHVAEFGKVSITEIHLMIDQKLATLGCDGQAQPEHPGAG